ncbi:PREDICTED: 3-ketoacyl-CoA synthase 6-like [Nelumbo nucifera]|uniref:3-ketoacyl-CoA synthase n=2 Tax=Nelumbo nucifera TaxID=4432 RepID=A0A1U7Z7R3_NELNU|nr:PREDICTED: 3-ketoacyl-CoA synthase 6-like [Nelumbo nucifera]DAD35896.1 TPA_asm: hypothetical protein HUJ06_006536 [Nelumbo nucifera]
MEAAGSALNLHTSKYLMRHAYSVLFYLIRFSTFLSMILMEAFLFLNKWRPIYQLLPLSYFVLFLVVVQRFLSSTCSIYMVDYSCLRPPGFCRVPLSFFVELVSNANIFNKETVDFMAKIITSSGQGEETYFPPSLHYIPLRSHQQDSINEVHMALFPVMDDLLSKTNISPADIDILIVNCTVFCPSPSLPSIIVNRYAMRDDIKTFHLSGMGCSASSVALTLVSDLLKVYKNSNAVILSTEILSAGWYPGNERSKLLLNCTFRMGGAAILLTNRNKARETSKYKLFRTVRSQIASIDKAHFSVMREEDSQGKLGVNINQNFLQFVGLTLRSHITLFGASILPIKEKLRYTLYVLKKRLMINQSGDIYVPNFRSVIQHFCLPVSGIPFIRRIGSGLKLTEREMEAAIMTFHRFGNQSSAAMWYELGYMEAKEMVKQGDKVWQLGLGTGWKAASVVWECLRDLLDEKDNGPWFDCIDKYPINSPRV